MRRPDLRVVEVAVGIVVHADPAHDRTRAVVGDDGQRDDLLELERFERKLRDGARGLAGEALSPHRPRQPPPDLDRRHERRLEPGPRESGEPDEGTGRPHVQSPQPPPRILHVRLDAIGQRVALAPGEQRRKVLHDLGVGVEDRERRAVLRSPVPQHEPVRLELVHGGQVRSPGTRRALRQKKSHRVFCFG